MPSRSTSDRHSASAMGDSSLPSINIPFPRHFVSDQPSPSDASDASHLDPAQTSVTPATTSDQTMDHKPGSSPSTKRTISLRWMDSPTIQNGSSAPARTRVPSLASATTVTSTLQSPQEAWFPRGGGAATEYEAAFAPEASDPSQPHYPHSAAATSKSLRTSRRRSVLQLFSRTFSKRTSTTPSLYPSSSPPSPVTSTPLTHLSASNPSLREFGSGSHYEHGTARTFAEPGICSEAPYEACHADEALAAGKSHEETKPPTTQRLRKKSRFARSEAEQAVAFDAAADLSPQDLEHAQFLDIYDEDGKSVKFGELWQGQRTCVIFIRHFWCPLCADYTRSIAEEATPEILEKAGVKLIVISNGSPAMIKPYRRIYKLPYPLYTDPSLAVYRALGMSLRTIDGGPDRERGGYVQHGIAGGITMVVRNALKARMPVHKNGGDIKQLGGEFVLGPGLHCSYVSRMRNTRSHAPVRDVLSAAGVDLGWDPVLDVGQLRLSADEDRWMREREAELRRIRARKGMRRGFAYEHRISESDDLESEETEVDLLYP